MVAASTTFENLRTESTQKLRNGLGQPWFAVGHESINQHHAPRALHRISRSNFDIQAVAASHSTEQNYPGPGQIGGSAPDLAAGQAASRFHGQILNPGLARSRARAGSRAFAISVWLKKRREK